MATGGIHTCTSVSVLPSLMKQLVVVVVGGERVYGRAAGLIRVLGVRDAL